MKTTIVVILFVVTSCLSCLPCYYPPAVISRSIHNLVSQRKNKRCTWLRIRFGSLILRTVLLQSSEYRKLDDARCLCWPFQQFGVDQTAVGSADGGSRAHLPDRPSEELRWNKASLYTFNIFTWSWDLFVHWVEYRVFRVQFYATCECCFL